MRRHLPQTSRTRTARAESAAVKAPRRLGRTGPGEGLLQLQRTRGNQYVQRLVASGRTGLRVGAADDAHEHEADRVADRIMRQVSGPGAESVRSGVEGALGVDLSGVRVHTGQGADHLNRGLGSLAFTHGTDVYFGAGRYSPGTRAGQHLLAHELTHVAQQGGAQGLVQRRMTYEQTNWEAATEAWSSGDGTTGVLFVKDADDPPVVVKSQEPFPVETIRAQNLHESVRKHADVDRWKGVAPRVRLMDGAEAQRAEASLSRAGVLREGDLRGPAMIQAITAQGAQPLVFEFAEGTRMDAFLSQPPAHGGQHSHNSGLPGQRQLGSDSPFSVFADKDFMKALGRQAAVDIFLGNADRVAGKWNPTNMFIEPDVKRFRVIDNIETNGIFSLVESWHPEAGLLQSDPAYRQWRLDRRILQLKGDKFTDLAKETMTAVKAQIDTAALTPKDRATVEKTLDAAASAFATGLRAGKKLLAVALEDQATGERLQSQIPPSHASEAIDSLNRRWSFIANK